MSGKDESRGTEGRIQGGVSRRGLLKVLAAAGGTAAVAAALPERWLKPIVEIGATPAHAQTSAPRPVVTNLRFGVQPPAPGREELSAVQLMPTAFDYDDPLGELVDTSTLSAELTNCAQVVYTDNPLNALPNYSRIGNGLAGTIYFGLPHLCNTTIHGDVCMTLGVNGRISLPVCGSYNLPY